MDLVKVIYIDDELSGDNQATDIAKRLNGSGVLDVSVVQPPISIQSAIAEWIRNGTMLFLIDFDLTSRPSDSGPYSYGTSLAAEIRSPQHMEYPIVIVTQKANEEIKEWLETANPIFDDFLPKSAINDNKSRDAVIARFSDLANAYKELRSITTRNFVALQTILKAPSEVAITDISEAGIPINKGEWKPEPLVRWLRHTFLEYPGLVMDDARAAAYLGIALKTFQTEWVQDLFSQSKYQGLFHASKPRWWKDQLLQIAVETAYKHEIPDIYFVGLTKALIQVAKENGLDTTDVLPSRCTWDHSEHANMLCHVRREPVQLKNSLRYYPDERMASYEPARISFRAIWEADYDEELVEPGSEEIIEQVRNMADPTVGAG